MEIFIYKALPGVWGGRAFILGQQGNKDLKMKGTWEQTLSWGAGNIENQDFNLEEQAKEIYFRRTREQVPLLEGLMLSTLK